MGYFESIHDDLHRFLAEVGVDQECSTISTGSEPMNPSPHRHYSTYYSQALVDQVYGHNRADHRRIRLPVRVQ